MEPNQRVAVITGAASGIGLALTEGCLQRGIHVVMADNAVNKLCDRVEAFNEGTKAAVLGVACDVTKIETIRDLAKQAYNRFGRVDWLFNNAGISGQLAPLWELTSEHIRKVMDINLHGAIHCLQTFLPLMFKQQHRSHIINIASVYGLCSGSQMAAYAMSKQAMVALSESLYFDLKRLEKPVDVSVVCPSFVSTQLLSNSAPEQEDKLHYLVAQLIARSRSSDELAAHILHEVEKKTFYILPDKEVKAYCEERTKAIIEQTDPHQHSLEKIINALSKRAMAD